MTAYQHEQNIELHNTITALTRSASDGVTAMSKSMGLAHPSAKFPLAVIMTLLGESELKPFSEKGQGQLLMVICDHERSSSLSIEALGEIYQLSKTEAGVAMAIVNGLTIKQVAESHGVKPSTIESQLKNIYGKMNVSRQQDLIRKILAVSHSMRDECGEK